MQTDKSDGTTIETLVTTMSGMSVKIRRTGAI